MNQKMQEEPKWKRTWHFIRPTVISVAVVLLAFFIMQGRPLATTLDRRTDLVSVVVTQNGAEQAFTDQDNIVRAAVFMKTIFITMDSGIPERPLRRICSAV